MKPTLDMVIENLIDATLGGETQVRSRHLLREALRGLVRLAKSEQMLEIKTNVYKLTGPVPLIGVMRRTKTSGFTHDKDEDLSGRQRQLEFNQNSPERNSPRRRDQAQ